MRQTIRLVKILSFTEKRADRWAKVARRLLVKDRRIKVARTLIVYHDDIRVVYENIPTFTEYVYRVVLQSTVWINDR